MSDSFESKLEGIHRNIKTIVSSLFPLSDSVKPFWTTPDVVTEFSLGIEGERPFIRYQCGDAIGDEFPHHNATAVEEFVNGIDKDFETIEFWVANPSEIIEEEFDEDDEDTLEEDFGQVYQSLSLIALSIGLAKAKLENTEIFKEECVFNVYNDFEDAVHMMECSPIIDDIILLEDEDIMRLVKTQCKSERVAEFIMSLKKYRKAGCSADIIISALNDFPDIKDTLFCL